MTTSVLRLLTVRSDESMNLFPDNTIAQFRNHINLDLKSHIEYEVCVKAVSYRKSWFNFKRDERCYLVYKNSESDISRRVDFSPGYYTIDQFRDNAINRTDIEVSKPNSRLKFRKETIYPESELIFHEPSGKFCVSFKQLPSNFIRASREEIGGRLYDSVIISKDLSKKIGFGDKERELLWDNGQSHQEYFSDFPIDFHPLDEFSVQTDLIKPSHHIGENIYSVIALVPSTGKHGHRHVYTPPFEPQFWYPLSKANIKSPEFVFISKNGKKVPFETGHSSVTLIIREIL